MRHLTFVIALAIGFTFVVAPRAAADRKLVTIAARSCTDYQLINANLARNNLQESLAPLGPDSPYLDPAVVNLMRPEIEELPPQDECDPLQGWRFTLGRGIQGRAVSNLSIVTDPFDHAPEIVTEDDVALRDARGDPNGGRIYGATTIELTDDEIAQISSGSLWIQGGTPTAPLTDATNYAFGALRCAIDNVNGDNVEYIRFPTESQHVFCFAYYVKPPPQEGTIRIVKRIDGLPSGTPTQNVPFFGDISFTQDGRFQIPVPNGGTGSMDFPRAAGRTWSFQEELGPLAALSSLDCVTRNGLSSYEQIGDSARPGARVTLAPGDLMTCTFVNTVTPPAQGLVLRKHSLGGGGDFGFSVTGGGASLSASATTSLPEFASLAEPADQLAQLPNGTPYRVEEELPESDGTGTWRLARVTCGAAEQEVTGGGITVTAPQACTFVNQFTPKGRLTIDKITLGGTGATRFQIAPDADPQIVREQVATTRRVGVPARATGDSTTNIPLGVYSIQESTASAEGARGSWRVGSVICNGVPVPSIAGRVLVVLTEAEPALRCVFTNELRDDAVDPPAPEPPVGPFAPPGPVPDAPAGGVAGASIAPDVTITKRARPRRVLLGERVRYRIVVYNRGDGVAHGVTVAEPATPTTRDLRLRASRGTCRGRVPRYCDIGRLAPRRRVVIRVRLRPRIAGRFLNRVAVNSATPQSTLRGKTARARLRVRALPRFTG